MSELRPVPFYIGTYTGPQGSKGIYRSMLDPQTGDLSQPELAVEAINPSFLALSPNRKFLFAVHETGQGSVSSYSVGKEGQLTRINTEPGIGADPCHLIADRKGQSLFISNYSSGDYVVVPVGTDGMLGSPLQKFQNSGSGPNAGRQKGPHAHFATPSSDGKFLYACDLGTDEVLIFRIEPNLRRTLAEPRAGKVPPGSGPRHFAWHPNGRTMYVNNEMTCTVTAFHVDRATGTLTPEGTVSTLPEGVASGAYSTAEIAVHPNGRWVFVSNRGHDSIATFAIQADGALRQVAVTKLEVKTPRSFSLDPSGKWLVVAGQNSHNLMAYRVQADTGQLVRQGQAADVSNPVCILFD